MRAFVNISLTVLPLPIIWTLTEVTPESIHTRTPILTRIGCTAFVVVEHICNCRQASFDTSNLHEGKKCLLLDRSKICSTDSLLRNTSRVRVWIAVDVDSWSSWPRIVSSRCILSSTACNRVLKMAPSSQLVSRRAMRGSKFSFEPRLPSPEDKNPGSPKRLSCPDPLTTRVKFLSLGLWMVRWPSLTWILGLKKANDTQCTSILNMILARAGIFLLVGKQCSSSRVVTKYERKYQHLW